MAQEATGLARELVALIRVDGHGELRDGDHVTRMHAADADELRGMVMERALAVAADEGVDVRVRTIDVDGVYPLVLTSTGGVEQDGEVVPLQPGDTDLTPEQDEHLPDGGYAALFGDAPERDDLEAPAEPLHETVRLPRASMMAPHVADDGAAEAQGEFDVDPDADEQWADEAELDEAPEETEIDEASQVSEHEQLDDQTGLDDDEFGDDGFAEDDESDTDARDADDDFDAHLGDDADDDDAPIAADLFDADEDVDDYHDEALDHDFDDLDSPSTALTDVVEEPAGAEWTPAFARDSRRARRESEHDRPAGYPEVPLFDEPMRDTAPEAQQQAAPAQAEAPAASGNAPTLGDFFASAEKPRKAVAERGWRANLRRVSGGLISLSPGAREQAERDEVAAIQRTFDGPRTIVVVNPKGGAHKTTATLMIAATFGSFRGGYTLAWDNNETRGTLGWRSKPGATTNTAVDLLRELPRFEISGGATIADVDRYVRNQGNAKFDVLASDDDAASAAIIDDDAFSRLHRTLNRFYRIMVVDTGNNMRASNWEAALDVADQLVVVSTAREDTAASAAWLADGLRERGYGDLLKNAVTIISSPSEKVDEDLENKLEAHFAQLTRAVVRVPYDQEFVGGGELDIPSLQPATREAWRRAVAVIAQGL